MSNILHQIHFRTVSPTDIPACFEIEVASYPADEAASKSALQYRQHHAARYFRCAVLGHEEKEKIVGYICSTRCHDFFEESMSVHDFSGPLLAIHSVVVLEEYRHLGIAHAMMKDYIAAMQAMEDGVEKLVLLSKSTLLGFYVTCGFTVVKPSTIVHGQDAWFDCELILEQAQQEESYPCWILDSFAVKAASGNPAAVVLLPRETDIDNEDTIAWMQVVAKEFNLSETAFMWPAEEEEEEKMPVPFVEMTENKEKQHDNDNEADTSLDTVEKIKHAYHIRYFTCNGTQVDLCGHATLASAAVLFQTLAITSSDFAVEFHAKRNLLQVMPMTAAGSSSLSNHNATQVKMNFPKKKLAQLDQNGKAAVLSMLKAAFSHLSPDEMEQHVLYVGIDEDGGDVLVEMTRDAFLKLGYDNISYSAFMEWDGYSRGVIVCCQEEPPQSSMEQDDDDTDDDDDESTDQVVDFLSRFFGPKAGINEDPVTGSAHCTLAPYFCTKLNKNALIGKQLSERGGIVTCIVEEERVSIIGTAITTVRGSLSI